jgi:hypothetical protein
MAAIKRDVRERFWEKVEKTDDHWLWTAARHSAGYGVIRVDGKTVYAHRLSYQWEYGDIPDGLEVDHRCRVPNCVRPDHLRVVTSAQNKQNQSRDAHRHSRTGVRGAGRRGGRYTARVSYNKVSYWLGTFDTAEEAGEAARMKRLELFSHNESDR